MGTRNVDRVVTKNVNHALRVRTARAIFANRVSGLVGSCWSTGSAS
jgi:hypothetical protein